MMFNKRFMRLPTICFLASLIGLGVAYAVDVYAEDKEKPAEPAATKKTGEVSGGGKFTAEQVKFFESEVKPILTAHCVKCHGGEKKIKGGLRLTNRVQLLQGGESGPAISIENPAESMLLDAINYGELEMPPGGKLPQKQLDILTRWVKMGSPWTPGGQDIVADNNTGPQINDTTRNHWSFKRVKRPEVPKVKDAGWMANPIDAFILAKLESAGYAPNQPASKATLIRRATYDLTGLPPSPEEVEAFVKDTDPKAYENLIDRLLASPHYGEKWARHWLDVVRYAETNSYERDSKKPEVWRYRDYVIRSFNNDKPYDQFVKEQLAGDELNPVTPDSIIATGFYRLGIWDDEPVDREQAYYDDMDDILATTSKTFFGLTVNCCRCHDHKIDPIPQTDYYRMLAFFHGIKRYAGNGSLRSLASESFAKDHKARTEAYQNNLAKVQSKVDAIEKTVYKKLLPVEKEDFKYEQNRPHVLKNHVPADLSAKEFDQYVVLRRSLRRLKINAPGTLGKALCISEIGRKPRDTFVLIRGRAKARGQKVEPGFPQILGFDDPKIPEPPKNLNSSGRRRVFADWVVSPENPLTARVFVNRLWQFHFGRGISRTPSNFGMHGKRPTHPQLLDWLASELVAGDWKVKRLHKLMMMSNTYQMASTARKDVLAKDPENNLFWRFNMRRMTAEEIRDSILVATGRLNPKMGGPSFYTIIPAEVLHSQSRPGAGWGKSSDIERARRSVYIHVKRSLREPLLASFDSADADTTCPVRFVTTQPAQALSMVNSTFINLQAEVFAEYLKKHAGEKVRDQVALGLTRVTQRPPTDAEVQRGMRFISSLQSETGMSAERSFKFYCLLTLNLNEFIYLD